MESHNFLKYSLFFSSWSFVLWCDFVIMWRGLVVTCCVSIMTCWGLSLTRCIYIFTFYVVRFICDVEFLHLCDYKHRRPQHIMMETHHVTSKIRHIMMEARHVTRKPRHIMTKPYQKWHNHTTYEMTKTHHITLSTQYTITKLQNFKTKNI